MIPTRVTDLEGWSRLLAPCALLWAVAALGAFHPMAACALAVVAGMKRCALMETIHDNLLPHDGVRAPTVEINRQKALQIWWWHATGQVRELIECPARLASWCKSWMHGADAAFFGALTACAMQAGAAMDAPNAGATAAALCLVLGLRAAEKQAATARWLALRRTLPLALVAAPMWPRANLGRADLWQER